MSGRAQPPARPACCPTRRALEEARHPRPWPVPGTKGAEAGPSLGGSPGSGHKPLSELPDPPRALSLGPTLLPGLLSPQPSLSWDYFKSGGSASWGTPPSHVQTDQGPRAVWSSRGLATLVRLEESKLWPETPPSMSLGTRWASAPEWRRSCLFLRLPPGPRAGPLSLQPSCPLLLELWGHLQDQLGAWRLLTQRGLQPSWTPTRAPSPAEMETKSQCLLDGAPARWLWGLASAARTLSYAALTSDPQDSAAASPCLGEGMWRETGRGPTATLSLETDADGARGDPPQGPPPRLTLGLREPLQMAPEQPQALTRLRQGHPSLPSDFSTSHAAGVAQG